MAKTSLAEVARYFGVGVVEMKRLTKQDRQELRDELGKLKAEE